MTQRIAPNNNLPATHFIEVFRLKSGRLRQDKRPFSYDYLEPFGLTGKNGVKPVAIFRIRENKLPTLHKF